jgi:hypothetical protein
MRRHAVKIGLHRCGVNTAKRSPSTASPGSTPPAWRCSRRVGRQQHALLEMLMDGRAQPTGIRRRGEDTTLLLVLNTHHNLVEFTLPKTAGGREWSVWSTPISPNKQNRNVSHDNYGSTGRPVSCSPFVRKNPAKIFRRPYGTEPIGWAPPHFAGDSGH